MNFPTLYKYTNSEQIQEWSIYVENNTFYTIEGIKGGQLTKSKPTVCEATNLGKTNYRSSVQQAINEAQSKWQKKLCKGYNEVLSIEKKFFEPMLAFERKKYEKLLFIVPTYVSRKLDGTSGRQRLL